MNAAEVPSESPWVQKFLLRPAVLIWVVLSVGMMGVIVGDIVFPDLFAPFGRVLSHRDNLASTEWRAALGAASRITPGSVVTVDTDNRVFFFTLRYRIYPIPAVEAENTEPFVRRFGGESITHVTYRSGQLRIEKEKLP